ncbi:MAG TPA: DUF4157 domain-containing protein [Dehalococcoidia bacterium]|nr:DUF4157 domain-containing protein [Dehalococcoidia bacterium]
MKQEKISREKKELKQDHHFKNDPELFLNKPSSQNETDRVSLDTPFHPRTEEHATLLEKATTGEQVKKLLLHLQRSYGNAYVQRLIRDSNIQTKLTISDPGDIYEQEADRVADEVTREVNVQTQRQPEEGEEEELLQPMPDLQRQPEDEEEEEELIQPKLDVQRQEEEEELVQMMPDLQRQPEEGEEEELVQMMLDLQRQDEDEELLQSKLAQRQTPEEDEELIQGSLDIIRQAPEEEEEFQMQLQDDKVATVADSIETRINNARSSGHPLSEEAKQPMEQAFEADFNNVKIHTDAEADTLNKQLNAKAFTTGQDIFFRDGEYSPGSESGKKLIAHELTHVMQQRSPDGTWRQKIQKKNKEEQKITQTHMARNISGIQRVEEITMELRQRAAESAAKVLDYYAWNWSLARQKLVYESEPADDGLLIMNRLIDYRRRNVNSIINDVVLDLIKREGGSDIEQISTTTGKIFKFGGKSIVVSAPGSTEPTSDYDITFIVEYKPELETELVKEFNKRFSEKFEGKPSAVVFDTNVYTSGFMSKEARKTYQQELGEKAEMVESGRMTFQLALSLLPVCQYIMRNAGEDAESSWLAFKAAVEADLDEYIDRQVDVLSPSQIGPARKFTADLTSTVLDLTKRIFDGTETNITNAKQQVEGTETEKKSSEINKLNELYQKKLDEVKKLLEDRRKILDELKVTMAGEKQNVLKQSLADNMIQFEEAQGEALVYAQEAYYSAGPAIHVVEGMQAGGKVTLLPNQKLQSILMNVGYKLQHYTEQKEEEGEEESGKAEMATAKYAQRIKHQAVWNEAHYLEEVEPLLKTEEDLVSVKKEKGIKSPREKLKKAASQGLSYEKLYGPRPDKVLKPEDIAMEKYIAIAVETIAPYLISEFKQRQRD